MSGDPLRYVDPDGRLSPAFWIGAIGLAAIYVRYELQKNEEAAVCEINTLIEDRDRFDYLMGKLMREPLSAAEQGELQKLNRQFMGEAQLRAAGAGARAAAGALVNAVPIGRTLPVSPAAGIAGAFGAKKMGKMIAGKCVCP